MSSAGEFGNPLRKFKLVFLGEQSGELLREPYSLDPSFPTNIIMIISIISLYFGVWEWHLFVQ